MKPLALLIFILISSTIASVAQYSFMLQWGALGTNDGQFNSSYDVACDTSGFVYVTDRYNYRVQKFTSSGEFILKWGLNGSNNGEFDSPHGLIVDNDGKIVVADQGNNRIQRFNSLGVYLMKFSTTGPADITVDYIGNYYVTDYGNCKVIKYDPTGVEISRWGTWGLGDGQFQSPQGIAIDIAGNIYVADQNNNRIQKFTNNGIFIRKWGTLGSGTGQFNQPLSIAIDKNQYIYVVDFGNNRIQKFDSIGNYITQWGQFGTSAGRFNNPTGIAVDTNGYVYVADYNNYRIQKFQWKNLEISTAPFMGNYCKGQGINITFSTNDLFNTSNTFIAQLSNSSGNFTNPIEIGRLIGTGSGIIPSAIPVSIVEGTGYRIRVIGTDPYVEGNNNGSDLTIYAGPNPVFTEEAVLVCEDVPGMVYTTGLYFSYSWTFSGIPGYDYIVQAGGTPSNNSSTVTWLMPGTRYVQVEVADANGCHGIVTSSVFVKEKPLFDYFSSSTITCVNQPIEFGTFSIYPEYSWNFTGTEGIDYNALSNEITSSSATVTWLTPGIKEAQLEISSDNGCKNSKTIYVQINPLPLPEFIEEVTNVCSGVQGNVYSTLSSFSHYTWTFSGVQGTDYIIEDGGGSTNNSTTMTWLTPGNKLVNLEVTNEYNCINNVISNVVVKQSMIPEFDIPIASICQGEDWNINTTTTFTAYNWLIPGIEGVDYTKSSGGTFYDNFVSLTWITTGTRTVELETYTENGCSAKINIDVNVYRKPSPLIYGELNTCQHKTELYITESDVGMISDWIEIGGEIIKKDGDSIFVIWDTEGVCMLKLVQTSLHGCKDSITKTITVKPMPDVTLQAFTDACVNDSTLILSGGLPPGGVYSGISIANGIFNPVFAGVGIHPITYTYLHNNGCVNTAIQNLKVNPQPAKPTIVRIGNTLSSSSTSGNQWYSNGSKMQEETRQFLNIQTLGFYQVQVIDVNGCISDKSDILQVDALGFSDIKEEIEIEIFPNPFEDKLNIKIISIRDSNIEFKIINLLGVVNYYAQQVISEGIHNYEIDTHLLRTGLYMICIKMNGMSYYSKIIKN